MVRGGAFHGRRVELAVVEEELARAAAGRLRMLLVEGEAGIGKSRFAAEVAAAATGQGFGVFYGRAEELGAGPFDPLMDALGCSRGAAEPERAGVAQLLAEAPAGLDPGLRFRVVDALVDVVERETLARPVLVVLDDLQWADASTLLTVATLARRLTLAPLLLVGLFRPSPRSRELERLVDRLTRDSAPQLVLPPLADDAVAELTREVLGARPGPQLAGLLAGAAGNPLFVGEVLAVLQAEGRVEVAGGVAEVAAGSLPPSLRVTLLRRIGYLPEPTLELLRLAAVLGASFLPGELAAVAARPVRELLGPLEDARRAGVLVGNGDAMRFRHDLIREAVYLDLPAGVRAGLHREAAGALAAAGAPVLRVAEQYRLGAVPGGRGVPSDRRTDTEAIGWLRRAAEETFSSDPAGAITLLRHAVELTPRGSARDDLLVQLATFYAYGGSAAEAERLARDLLARPLDTPLEPPAWQVLTRALVSQGRWSEVVTQAAMGCRRKAVDDVTRGRLLSEAALASIWMGDLQAAESRAREAVRLGEATGDPVALAFGLGHLSGVGQQRGEFEEALATARRALQIAERGGREAERRHPWMILGMALVFADRLREAVAAFTEGRHRGERAGTVWDAPVYHAMLALPLYLLGEWDEAVAAANTSLALADESSGLLGSVAACSVLADIAVHRDDLAEAHRFVDLADEIVTQSGPQWGATWLAIARAHLLVARGDVHGARGELRARCDFAQSAGYLGTVLVVGPPLARLTEPDHRLAVAHGMELAARASRVPFVQAGVLVCRGLAEDDPAALLDAIRFYRASGRIPDVAATCVEAGAAFARRGDVERARALFEEALAAFAALGAVRSVARVTAASRAAGIRHGVRGARTRPSTGWEALTRAELGVVRLVADGLTNAEIGERLFISRATVKTHLEHIFAKLDVPTRRVLAAEARRRAVASSRRTAASSTPTG